MNSEIGLQKSVIHRPAEPPPGLDEFEQHVMASDSPAVVIINRTLVRALLRYATCLSAVRQRPRPRPMICCSSSTVIQRHDAMVATRHGVGFAGSGDYYSPVGN